MSRAFMKEDTAAPPLVVPRAPLPEGVPNYVTRRGLALLRAERAALEVARPHAEGLEGAAAAVSYQARLGALDGRIHAASLVDPETLPHDEVRFSAVVSLRGPAGERRRYRIVGVDEAEPKAGRIAFTAPLAAELTGKRVGDAVMLRGPGGQAEYEITAIDYTQE